LNPSPSRPALIRTGIAILAITGVLAIPWAVLIKATLGNSLHGYAAAIPAICLWLIWQRAGDYRDLCPRPATALGVVFALLAVGAAAGGWIARETGHITEAWSFVSSQMLGWVFGVWATVFMFLGADAIRRYPFPFAFLLFTVPLPVPAVDGIEVLLQHGSAWAVDTGLRLLNITYARDEYFFWLPGLRFEIATECSGVRSTLVLLIVSILGAHVLLRSPWRQGVIGALIIPLGIARNALRILTLALLSIHVDPRIIDSPLHHRGGPLFFAISLIPLLAVFAWFRKSEQKSLRNPASPDPGFRPPTHGATPPIPPSEPQRTAPLVSDPETASRP